MRKRIIPLLLAVIMLLTGCAHEEPERNVVGEVNGQPIYESEVNARAEALLFGLGSEAQGETTRESKKRRKQSQIAALDSLIEMRVLMLLAQEYGTAELSAEEELAVQAAYEASLDAFRAYIEQEYTNSFSAFSPAQVEQGVDKLLEMQGTTREGFLANLRQNRIITTTKAAIRAGIQAAQIDAETVRKKYDELIETQKSAFADNPSKFEGMYGGDDLLVYTPEGFREVLCIRQRYGELDAQIISQLRAQGQYAQAEESAKKAFEGVAEAVEQLDQLAREQGEALVREPEQFLSDEQYRRVCVCSESTGYTAEELAGIFGMTRETPVCGPYAGALSGNVYILIGEVPSGAVPLDAVYAEVAELAADEGGDAYLEQVVAQAMKQYQVKTHYNRL